MANFDTSREIEELKVDEELQTKGQRTKNRERRKTKAKINRCEDEARCDYNGLHQITEETICRFFKTCEITVVRNGEEDHLIQCSQPDVPIPFGLQALQDVRVKKEIEVLVKQLESVGFKKFGEEAENIEEIDSDAAIDFNM